jgi:cobaltochelatase CobN
VKDKYKLGLRRFFEQQNPHARQTLLARLLDVDRQKIYRFTPADRKMLLTEYARSVVRDGAACSAQVCGNAALRKHVADQLRAEGLGSAAAKLESAFRRALQKPFPTQTVTKKLTLPDFRHFKIAVVNLVKQLPVVWKVDAIPGWVWGCIAGAYLTIIGVRLRMRRLQGGIETLRIGYDNF